MKQLIKRLKNIYYIVTILISLIFAYKISAMTSIVDHISTSKPDVLASHEFIFKASRAIAAGGKIEIIFEPGYFTLENGFDYTDVDFAVGPTMNGAFVEREVSEFQNIVSDRASAVSTLGGAKVFLDLNTSTGIDVGSYVRIRLGTNSQYGQIGDRGVFNPSQIGSRFINLIAYDSSGNRIDSGSLRVAIINPVQMSSYATRKMMNGSPNGWLSYGTTQTIMSLMTNYKSFCRYSTSSSTPYALMSDNFSYVGGERSYYHTVLLNGLTSGSMYTYYIRCDDGNNTGDSVNDCYYQIGSSTIDQLTGSTTNFFIPEIRECVGYEIKFNVTSVAGSSGDFTGNGNGGTGTGGGTGNGTGAGTGAGTDTSTGNTSGGGGGGGGSSSSGGGSSSSGAGGAGGGVGGGRGVEQGSGQGIYLPYPPLPGIPGVIMTGFAYPNVDVNVLKDGQTAGLMKTDAKGVFKGFVENLVQGTYSFGLWANDSAGNKSSIYSSTFFIQQDTQTTVSDIILAPTLKINNQSNVLFNVYGESVPLATVEVWFYPKKAKTVTVAEIIKASSTASSGGKWSVNIDTSKLKSGQYLVKARSIVTAVGASGFSQILEYNLNVVATPKPSGACSGGDLNKDGKVNITDFSILLYNWNTADACADQNNSGKVDLIDFSIMMFYWTG